MSANKESNLVQGYIELNKFCQSGDYDRALKAAGKVLQIAPTEQKAFHCKIICFIQLHNFKEALAVLSNPKNAPLAADLHFEKAYVQYRLNCPKDALETVDSAPEMTLALKELRAQILYRLEQYQDCYNLYREIVKNTTDEYEDERKANMSAVVANLAALNPQMGREKEAATMYHNVLKEKPSDQALVAIASNNLVVINRDSNVFDSRKRMKAATADGLENKLNSRQRAAIVYNQAILAIYSNQPDFCKQCCVKLSRELKQEQRAALVEAASLAREGRSQQAVALLVKQGGMLTLAAAQLLLAQSEVLNPWLNDASEGTIPIARSRHQSDLFYPPVLLHHSASRARAGAGLLSGQGRSLCGRQAGAALREVWRAAASVHARAGAARDAAAALEALAAGDPADERGRARLVKALAPLDPDRARALAAHLPPILKQGQIDIEALESSNWMMGAKVVKKTVQSKQEQSPGTPGSELGQKMKAKRKRKTKLPPNADLSRPPDPERWLPKYERAAFRKRRGGRRGEVIKGSQGMSTAAVDAYDMSKQTPSAGAAAAAAKSPRVEHKAAESAWQRKQQQKKKGKGRKW
ncbi:unnamed protein product, partial [Iphiclides podalirius]